MNIACTLPVLTTRIQLTMSAKKANPQDAKKVEAKKVEAKKVETKKVEAKKVEAKKVEAKKEVKKEVCSLCGKGPLIDCEFGVKHCEDCTCGKSDCDSSGDSGDSESGSSVGTDCDSD